MQFSTKILTLLCAAIIAAPCTYAQKSMRMTPGDVKNFSLPSFEKKTGFKEWEIFGSSANYVSDEQVFVKDMRLELFNGKEDLQKTAEFKSDTAEFSISETRAKSADTLFVSGDSFKLQGDNWLWSGAKRFVNLNENVSVEFTAERDGNLEKLRIKSAKAAMDYSTDADKFVFENSVNVIGESFTIECDRLKTQSPKSGGRSLAALKEIEAEQNVKITQEKISATAQAARLIPSSGDLSLLGSPMVIDTSSKASVSGDRIDFEKEKSLATAHSSADKRVRAKALIISERDGKEQASVISADRIEMHSAESENTFHFKGNVHVIGDGFEAFGDKITAKSDKNSDNKKSSITRIFGDGNIRFVSQNRTATGDRLEIYTQNGEVWLKNNARLEDKPRGITLDADNIVLLRENDRAIASGNGNSRITLTILQSENFGLSQQKEARKTVIQSRSLRMDKTDSEIILNFMRDVEISSEDIRAKCEFMDVYAEAESIEGRTAIRRIEAFENVVVNQKGSQAQAQIVKIFPRIDVQISKTQRTQHRYILLLSPDDEPQKRPLMILPPIESIGLAETDKKAARKNTLIESDKQSFVSGEEKDTYIFEGNVVINGTDFAADCQKVEVEMKPDKSGKRNISLIVMTDNVSVSQGKRSAAAGRADIYPEQEMIALTDSPIVVNEDGTQARGSRITFTKGKSSLSIENPTIRLPQIGGGAKK